MQSTAFLLAITFLGVLPVVLSDDPETFPRDYLRNSKSREAIMKGLDIYGEDVLPARKRNCKGFTWYRYRCKTGKKRAYVNDKVRFFPSFEINVIMPFSKIVPVSRV